MHHTIIVPVDGSGYSEQALIPATVLARRIGAKLVLVRAAMAPTVSEEDRTNCQMKPVSDVDAYLADLAQRLRGEGIGVETVSSDLSPSSAILLEIDLSWADMVVMCVHSHAGLEGWLMGSVAEDVVSQSPTPVLLVKPSGSEEALRFGSSKSPLLVPLDGSSYAEAALPHAVALSHALDRDIVLLRVVEAIPLAIHTPQTSWPVPVDAAGLTGMGLVTKWKIQAAADYLTHVEESLNLSKGRVRSVVRLGHPVEAIQEESKAANASLIVMATHGRTGLGEVMLGSVALKEVQTGSLPVYLVSPGELVKTRSGLLDTGQPVFSAE